MAPYIYREKSEALLDKSQRGFAVRSKGFEDPSSGAEVGPRWQLARVVGRVVGVDRGKALWVRIGRPGSVTAPVVNERGEPGRLASNVAYRTNLRHLGRPVDMPASVVELQGGDASFRFDDPPCVDFLRWS